MRTGHKTDRAIRVAIEGLECRRLFAVLVTPVDSDGDGANELIITGDGNNNRVIVYDDDQNDRTDVVLDTNNNGAFDLGEVNFPFAEEFEETEVSLGGGNDTLRYFLVTDLESGDRRLLVDLGSGDNKLIYSSPTTGSSSAGVLFDTDGADIIDESDVVIQADASTGKDTFDIDLSRTTISSSRVNIDLNGSGGSDTFSFKTPDFNQNEDGIVADGSFKPSQVIYDPSGGGGTTNTYNFDIFSDIEDGSTLDMDIEGGTAKDVITSNFSLGLFSSGGLQRSGLDFQANLGDGADSFLGNVDLGTLASFLGPNTQARFNVNGQANNDIIRYRDVTTGGGDSGQIAGLLDLSASGGAQHDTVTCDLDTLGGARLSVTSSGEFRSIMNGGTGNDTVFIDLVTGVQTTGLLELAVLGGSGDDKVSLALKDDGNAVYAGGKALLDGGLGTDRWDTEGDGLIIRTSTEILDESLQAPQ